jgi:hypothetical protein
MHVDTFNLYPGGTLMVELTTNPTQVPGVEAANANVNGTILALYNRGFYDHELVYEDVADSPNLAVDETTFDVDNNSAVLVTVSIIDEDAIDLEATRHPSVR